VTDCNKAYGDVVRVTVPGLTACLVYDPELIQEVLLTRGPDFVKPRLLYRRNSLVGNGLLSSAGELWRRQRSLVQPAFHKSRLERYAIEMLACTERMLATWRHGEVRDIHRDMTQLSLDVVARTLFGVDLDGGIGPLQDVLDLALEQYSSHGSRQGPWRRLDRRRRFRRASRRLDAFVFDLVEQRRRDSVDRADLLSALVTARDESGAPMSDRQLRDEIVTMLLAGHETSALALTWTWHLLGHDAVADRSLLAELRAVLGTRPPRVENRGRLAYTEAVVMESLRLYPPVWIIGREVVHDRQLGGYRIARGTNVGLSQWAVQRDPRFFEEPDRFRPERWLDGGQDRLGRLAYFPFGGGHRICIGMQFALTEAVLVVAAVAQRFRLTPVGRAVTWPSITLRPRHGLPMLVTRR
jgi:cytochrome P450